MSATVAERPVDPAGPPAAVRQSVVLWLGAILAGVAEALVHLAGPVPPTGPELAVRAGIYLVLAVLVLQLHTGRDAIRWTVVVVLGVFGTLSLVVEPVRALLAAALRALHVAEVLAALVLLFHPAARRFFRGPQRAPAGIR